SGYLTVHTLSLLLFFFFQAEDGIRDWSVTGVQTCALPICNINTVSLLKTSGFPAYDDKIQNTIRRDWRYRPYLVNGKATPVCTRSEERRVGKEWRSRRGAEQ